MARTKRAWSKTIEESGIQVRIYERVSGSVLAREVRTPGGEKDRKSLGHRDRALAEQQARQLARRLAELRLSGFIGRVELGHLIRLYTTHRAPLLSEERRTVVTRMYAPYFLAHFGDRFALEDLGQSHIDGYVLARRTGAIKSARHRGVSTPPRDGTIRSELNWFKSVIRWARGFKIGGQRLFIADPLEGIRLVQEKNPRRPVASEDRFQRTLAVCDRVDGTGRLACMLTLARYTGRRVNAICSLRAQDVLLTTDQVLRGLAAIGEDERRAQHMPHGAIIWREDVDKLGFLELTAISAPARAALERYLRHQPSLGSAPLFPVLTRPGECISKVTADYLLRSAEAMAGIPKLERGLWHPYRRAWASERKHLPLVDTARSGGWRDTATMQTSYQQPDAATMLRVIENAPSGHTSDTPSKASADGTTR